MRKSRFSEEQIAYTLRQAEAGAPVKELCRKLGISEQTFYLWKKKYAGMGVLELKRVKQLGGKPAVEAGGGGPDARQGDAAGRALKKVLGSAVKRERVGYLRQHYRVSERRSCGLLLLRRSTCRYA